MKTKTLSKVESIAPLFGRCLAIDLGDQVIGVKVMGDRGDAAADRDRLLAAFAAAGIAVKEAK